VERRALIKRKWEPLPQAFIPLKKIYVCESWRLNSNDMTTAFKEWEIVCHALAIGNNHLIFRKGGIHEGRDGFSFKHDQFALFPTRFHEQGKHVTIDCPPSQEMKGEWKIGEEVKITHLAQATWARTLTDWEKVKALAPYHIYSEGTLSDRFHWEGKNMPTNSIHVALIRTFALKQPLRFPYEKKYAGCRSWIDIPDYDISDLKPVLSDHDFNQTLEAIRSAL